MAALACLRVVVRSDQTNLSEAMFSALVAKFTSAFLEVRWSWPRKFSALNPYAFLLNDPTASELDTAELGRLSAELHAHLFGVTEDESTPGGDEVDELVAVAGARHPRCPRAGLADAGVQ